MILIRQESWQDYKNVEELLRKNSGTDTLAVRVNRLRLHTDYRPGLSLVAMLDWKLVGHLLLFPLPVREGEGVFTLPAVASLFVDPGFRRQGIGTRLIRMGLQEAARTGYSLVLAADSGTFFSRLGFISAEQQILNHPEHSSREYFYIRELVPGALSAVTGVVDFPVEWGARP